LRGADSNSPDGSDTEETAEGDADLRRLLNSVSGKKKTKTKSERKSRMNRGRRMQDDVDESDVADGEEGTEEGTEGLVDA
jgi:hypothetical protein